ncbi:hypothetical protein [Streptacidiphilus sp. MAP12-16]|uniref:hypothetical protein n=1 Tax=Streptacidiphilus sp. MAP12-16 TaxID=3156300 RepID=UPI0035113CCF
MTTRFPGRHAAGTVITALVAAVRADDDEHIRELLRCLATCADVEALYALREALIRDLGDADERRVGPQPGRARSGGGAAGHGDPSM